MGFWKMAGKVAKFIGKTVLDIGETALEEVKSASARCQQYKAEMVNKSDDELFEIIKKDLHSIVARCGQVLQD